MAGSKFNLQAIISAVDKVSGPIKNINRSLRGVRKNFRDLSNAGSTLATNIGLPVTLLGGASVAAITKSVGKFMELGSSIHDAAQVAGASNKQWQELIYLGEQNGVAADTMKNSVGKLNKTIADSARGKNKDALALFKKLGINLKDSNGHIRSGADLMPELADAFDKNTNAAMRATMAQTLFGKSGKEMLPIFKGGSKAVQEQYNELHKLGGVLSDESVAAADELGDKWNKLQVAGRGLQLTIGSKLAPVLQPLIEKFTNWIVLNRELISQKIQNVVSRIAAAIERVDWNKVADGLSRFWGGIEKIVSVMGGWDNAMIGFLVIANATTIAALFQVGFAIFGIAMSVAKLIGPVAIMTGKLAKFVGTIGMAKNASAGMATVVGRLGALAAAGFIGYQIGDKILRPLIDKAVQLVTGNKDATLGTALYDSFNDDINLNGTINARRKNQAGGFMPGVSPLNKQNIQGKMTIDITGLPPGSTVSEPKSNVPGFDFNVDAGYRSAAWGG